MALDFRQVFKELVEKRSNTRKGDWIIYYDEPYSLLSYKMIMLSPGGWPDGEQHILELNAKRSLFSVLFRETESFPFQITRISRICGNRRNGALFQMHNGSHRSSPVF